MKAIYLIGFMGAGKTTIGQLLSRQLNIPFLDIDQHIEKITNQSIASIFSSIGEKGFRTMESDTLRKVPSADIVIATGGGIIENGENIQYMKEHGIVIYLHNSFANLYKRIQQDGNRPLAFSKSTQEVEQLYKSRLPLYEKATHVIHTSNKSAHQVQQEIIELLTKSSPFCK